MIRRGSIGSGLTRKPTIGWDDKADETDPEIAAMIQESTLDGMVAAIEQESFAVMAEAGLPTYHGCFAYNREGEWHDSEAFGPGWTIANEIWPIARARGLAPDSPIGFAARMLGDIVWLRDNQARGDHDRAALFHGYLMTKKAERRLKAEHEAAWKTGVEQRRTLDQHRETAIHAKQFKAEECRRLWQDEANTIWASHPSYSCNSVGRIIAGKLEKRGILANADTIRRAIKKVGITG